MRWGQPLWNSMKTMKSYVSSTCDYRRSLVGKSDQGWHFCGRTSHHRHPPPPPNCYYVLVLRGKHVQQRSANSKVIHQQNEIINVINTCSHASIFRRLEIGPGGREGWLVVGVGGVGLIFLTSGNCQLPEGFGLAFIKTSSTVSAVAPRCLGQCGGVNP